MRLQSLGRVARALVPVALGCAAWLAVTSRAQGGPVDDGVPSGTVAFVRGGLCPPGWMTATDVQGRLVVAVKDGADVGTKVGIPLGDQEDRQHQHAYSGMVTLGSKNIAGSDGSNDQGAAAQSYVVMGTTGMASSSLPFVQVQPCVKP